MDVFVLFTVGARACVFVCVSASPLGRVVVLTSEEFALVDMGWSRDPLDGCGNQGVLLASGGNRIGTLGVCGGGGGVWCLFGWSSLII